MLHVTHERWYSLRSVNCIWELTGYRICVILRPIHHNARLYINRDWRVGIYWTGNKWHAINDKRIIKRVLRAFADGHYIPRRAIVKMCDKHVKRARR